VPPAASNGLTQLHRSQQTLGLARMGAFGNHTVTPQKFSSDRGQACLALACGMLVDRRRDVELGCSWAGHMSMTAGVEMNWLSPEEIVAIGFRRSRLVLKNGATLSAPIEVAMQRFNWLFLVVMFEWVACKPVVTPRVAPGPTPSELSASGPTDPYPSPVERTPVPVAEPTDFYHSPPDWTNPILLKLGETAVFHYGGLRITFVQVVEDTRCVQATCSAKGNAQVRLRLVRADAPAADLLLNTQPDLATTGWYIGYAITLPAVEPDLNQVPHPGKTDYAISIRVLLI
jgi:hypothetical protein